MIHSLSSKYLQFVFNVQNELKEGKRSEIRKKMFDLKIKTREIEHSFSGIQNYFGFGYFHLPEKKIKKCVGLEIEKQELTKGQKKLSKISEN